MAKTGAFNFNAPIPGMSLTTEPGNRPWEQPPKYADMEDVIEHYLGKLSDDEKLDEMIGILERGLPVNTLVDSLITSGSMFGLHTIESGLMAAPVLSEFMQAMADIEGIEYTVSAEDKKHLMKPADAARFKKMLDEEVMAKLEGESSEMDEEGPEEETESAEQEIAEHEGEPQKGLMARPVAVLAEVETPEQEGEE